MCGWQKWHLDCKKNTHPDTYQKLELHKLFTSLLRMRVVYSISNPVALAARLRRQCQYYNIQHIVSDTIYTISLRMAWKEA